MNPIPPSAAAIPMTYYFVLSNKIALIFFYGLDHFSMESHESREYDLYSVHLSFFLCILSLLMHLHGGYIGESYDFRVFFFTIFTTIHAIYFFQFSIVHHIIIILYCIYNDNLFTICYSIYTFYTFTFLITFTLILQLI